MKTVKKFIEPEMKCLFFTVEDVLTTSSIDTPKPDPIPTVDEDEGMIV